MPVDVVSELSEYPGQFEDAKQQANRLVDGLSNPAFNWRAEPGQWSISECLLHLTKTGQAYLPAIDEGIDRGRARAILGNGPYRYGLLANWIIRANEPPVKRKLKAPKKVIPIPDQPISAVLPTFLHLQDQIIVRLQQSNGLDLARIKVKSPLASLLRISLGATFQFLAAHQRRHIWQAQQVRNHPDFPAR